MPEENEVPVTDQWQIEAKKRVQRNKHQFIIGQANSGKSHADIKQICDLIDWGLEISWLAEDLKKKDEEEKKAAMTATQQAAVARPPQAKAGPFPVSAPAKEPEVQRAMDAARDPLPA